MIDLHSHTNESDGTLTPRQLVDTAVAARLDALAITDHDTLTGYDQALPYARSVGLDLVCGIELGTRFSPLHGSGKNVHLLGYFLGGSPSDSFREWILELQADRRDRNIRLIQRLRSLGVDIHLSQVEAVGRSLTGRPHFARVLIEKGYAHTSDEAFRKYLGESAPGYVERESPPLAVAIQRVIEGGGVPVAAHPVRLGYRHLDEEDAAILEMRDAGLLGLEVIHSDHSPADVEKYRSLAATYRLAMTGGSDFHGAAKPRIALGSGINGNVQVPKEVLDTMRARFG